MSTQLEEKGDYWLVSTVASPGKRKKLGRGTVRVPKGDPERLKAEMLRQAEKARLDFAVEQPKEDTVV